MTIAIKSFFTDEPLWKLAIKGIKYYTICYLLILIPYTVVRFILYFYGNINGSKLWDLVLYIHSISVGATWFYIKNKENMSKHINKGRYSETFRNNLLINVLLVIIGFVMLLFIEKMSYFIRYFPSTMIDPIVYSVFSKGFSNDLLEGTYSIWSTSIDFVDIYKMFQFAITFTTYNIMKYLFDKSILAD